MYRLPKGLRYSSLKEREEFYKNEFRIKTISNWLAKRKNTVFACIIGRHTKIFPEKFKKIANETILIDRYKNLSDLRRWILKFLPESVYYDRNLYDDLDKCRKCKKKECFNCKNFLGQELAFDIDPENVKCPYHGSIVEKMRKKQGLSFCMFEFRIVKNQAIKIYDELKKNFSKIKFTYSGRGIHLHVFDEDAYLLEKKEREKIANEFLRKGYAIDEWVTNGEKRLIRLPFSLHAMVSRICIPLKLNEIKNFNPIKNKKCIPKFIYSKD
jgi:DNA primase catalytic subunit